LLLANIAHGFRDPIHVASQRADALAEGLGGGRIALVGLGHAARERLEQGYQQAQSLIEAIEVAFPLRQAKLLAQQWLEAAESLGYREMAETVRELEDVLDAPQWDRARTALLLANIAHGFRDPIHAASGEEADALSRELKGERIALVGLGQREAEGVCVGLRRAGMRPYLFDGNEPPTSEAIQNCSAVIVEVRPETAQSIWLRPKLVMREAKALVLMGARADILALDPAVLARAHDCLIGECAPEEVVMRLGFARARIARRMADRARRETEAPARAEEALPRTAVLAQKSPTLTKTLARAAAESAIDCVTAEDGTAALETIRQRRPGAAVLEVGLAGMDGFALLSKIRAEKLPVKVLLLTAEASCAEMVKGFQLGADDCMLQPINPSEFSVRLARLLSNGSGA
jgi:CheY-like chemotaxis protein